MQISDGYLSIPTATVSNQGTSGTVFTRLTQLICVAT
jgi:hypothetical protein